MPRKDSNMGSVCPHCEPDYDAQDDQPRLCDKHQDELRAEVAQLRKLVLKPAPQPKSGQIGSAQGVLDENGNTIIILQ